MLSWISPPTDLANTDPQLLTYLNVGIEVLKLIRSGVIPKIVWKTTKVNLTRYAERVKEGSEKLLKDLLNLKRTPRTGSLDKEPRSPTIALAAPKRYKIAGKMNTVRLRPA